MDTELYGRLSRESRLMISPESTDAVEIEAELNRHRALNRELEDVLVDKDWAVVSRSIENRLWIALFAVKQGAKNINIMHHHGVVVEGIIVSPSTKKWRPYSRGTWYNYKDLETLMKKTLHPSMTLDEVRKLMEKKAKAQPDNPFWTNENDVILWLKSRNTTIDA